MKRAKISELSVYLPERVVSNQELEERVNAHGQMLPPGGLHRLFGIEARRFAALGQQVSDLAVAAAMPIVEKVGASNIGHLIFAAACADLIEPATCNIVQHKLGLHCPAMDIKNACNSFTTALMTASSLIAAGICDNVLVVNGEKLSDSIRFEFENQAQFAQHLAALSFGDAGAAALVSRSDDESGIYFQRFLTKGEHWELCTIKGGGSMYPHDASKTYFEGQTAALKDVLAETARTFFRECLADSDWRASEILHFFTHQVSVGTTRLIAQLTGVAPSAVEEVFSKYGNTAAASIPLAMHQRLQRGEIKKGERFALVGLAAGVSVSVQLGVW
ncbi:MAG: 3-oxoacyl-ACP synthase III family protein [Saprospiraceae bacterium]